MERNITNMLARLETYEDKFITSMSLIMQAQDNALMTNDLIAAAATNRAISLISGYITLARNDNYLAAVNLVRLQIDNSLRFYATFIAKDHATFINCFLGGQSIRKLKSKTEQFLTDSHLVDLLEEYYPNLKKAYNRFSGFIHLSNQHLYAALSKNDNNKFQVRIGKNADNFSELNKIEITETLIYFSDILLHLFKMWIDMKNTKFN